MENEIMNYDEVINNDSEIEMVETEGSGISTGAAMAIGAGLAMATAAVVKLGKKLFAAYKAKKESKESDDKDYEEVSD